MAARQKKRDDTIRVGEWNVERLLAMGRIEGGGPLNVEDECRGHCCLHGVYIALPERDRILEYADRIVTVMDDTQPPDTQDWFEGEIYRDEDFEGGLCIGTATYNDKCAFLNSDGLCVLQLLEPQLELPDDRRLKPFYCRLFPLTTWYGRLEFDDMCDGVRPCCTLAADGPTRAVEAYEYEFTEALGEDGYVELKATVEQLEENTRSAAGERNNR